MTPPNQLHRGEVRKLLVHPDFRLRGLARVLMLALEDGARHLGRWLLTLDSASAGAEHLYSSLGYESAGVIPDFSIDPSEGRLDATTIMYKRIGKRSTEGEHVRKNS